VASGAPIEILSENILLYEEMKDLDRIYRIKKDKSQITNTKSQTTKKLPY
jgi:hypothetical protein